MSIRLTRRAVLGGASAAVLSACTRSRHPAAAPPVDPDIALAAAAVVREQELLTAYDRLLSSVGLSAALLARLAPLRAEHAVHLQAVGATSPSIAPSSSSSATPAPSASAAPGTVAQLVALERRNAAAHGEDCLLASRRLAPVLASLAASETTHVGALT